MEEKSKEIIVKEGSSPAEMIMTSLKGGASLEQMEKFIELQERYDATQARKAYAVALVETQSKIPVIKKTRKNKQTSSMYADLSDIVQVVTPIYTDGGFSMTFYEGNTDKENYVRICADVMHLEGHKETYHYDAPMDGKGIQGTVNMTQTHAKATTIQYGKRYLMCMVWNIPTGDDSDGNTQEIEKITDKELSNILDMINSVGSTEEKMLKYMNIDKLENMPKSGYDKAIKALEAKGETK